MSDSTFLLCVVGCIYANQMYMQVCMPTYAEEVLGHPSLSHLGLFSWNGLSLKLELTCQPESPIDPFNPAPCLQHWGYQVMLLWPAFLWVLGFKLRSFCLYAEPSLWLKWICLPVGEIAFLWVTGISCSGHLILSRVHLCWSELKHSGFQCKGRKSWDMLGCVILRLLGIIIHRNVCWNLTKRRW